MITIFVNSALSSEYPPIQLRLGVRRDMSADQFFDFCQQNKDLRIERNSKGEISVMQLVGCTTGIRDAELSMQLRNWAKKNGMGVACSSSTGFTFPNGAVRSPDAAWVSHARLKKVTEKELEKFPPVCPEFVIELKSPSDRVNSLKAKMEEYMDNGVLLGLLIVAEKKLVYKYQPKKPVKELKNKQKISCEPVLPGFDLIVKEVW